jgi:hypothetical protein
MQCIQISRSHNLQFECLRTAWNFYISVLGTKKELAIRILDAAANQQNSKRQTMTSTGLLMFHAHLTSTQSKHYTNHDRNRLVAIILTAYAVIHKE